MAAEMASGWSSDGYPLRPDEVLSRSSPGAHPAWDAGCSPDSGALCPPELGRGLDAGCPPEFGPDLDASGPPELAGVPVGALFARVDAARRRRTAAGAGESLAAGFRPRGPLVPGQAG